jgi:hypothetical protein
MSSRTRRPQANFSDWADQTVFSEVERIFHSEMSLYGATVPACVEKLLAETLGRSTT